MRYVQHWEGPRRLSVGDVLYCKIKQKGYQWVVREVKDVQIAGPDDSAVIAQSVTVSYPQQGSARLIWRDSGTYGSHYGTPHFHFVRHAKSA